MSDLLTIEGLGVRFGGVTALEGVDLAVPPGEIRALVGPNGAGKSTLVNSVTGYQPQHRGRVSLAGKRLSGLPPHRIARLGVARTFQTPELFSRLTVAQNVAVADFAAGGRRGPALLRRLGLEAIADSPAADISYGQMRLLEMARALALGPRLLLLDEPAAGLTAEEVEDLVALLRRLAGEERLTILLIEHNMAMVAAVADRVTVLDYGSVLVEGPPDAVLSDPRVIAAYLGEDEDEDGNDGGAGDA